MQLSKFVALVWLGVSIQAFGATVTIEELWLRTTPGGDPVPGRPAGVVFRESTGLDGSGRPVMLPPSINNSGQVVFRARSASQANDNANNAFGIYSKRPSFPMGVLADTTCDGGATCVSPSALTPTFAVPGRPAGTRFTDFKAPLINDAGDVVFYAKFGPVPGSSVQSGSGFYATTVSGGPIVKIADTFTTVPGFPTATFRTFDFTIAQLLTVSLNNAGQVVYWGDFLIPPAVFPNVTNAIFGTTVAGGSGIRLVDSTQVPTINPPLGGPGGFREIRPTPVINNAGTVIFAGNLGPSPSLRNGIFAVPVTGGTVSTVAFRGQSAPGRPGPPSAITFGDTFDPAGYSFDVNDSGVVVFRNGYGGTETGNYAATPSGSSYVLSRIIDTFGCTSGPCLSIPAWPFPNLETVPSAEYDGNAPPTVNESGQTGVFSRVISGSVSNQQGIFATDIDGTPNAVVANLSTVPPGPPTGGPAQFSNGQFVTEAAAINDSGHMAFGAGGSLTPGSFIGLYFYDACAGALSRVSDSTIALGQLGSSFTFSGSTFRYDIWQTEGRSGHLKSFSNNNDVVFAAAFNSTDSGMFIAHINAGSGGTINISCPPNVVSECPANTNPSATGTASATGCGTITVSHSDATTTGCGASYSISRTWSASNGSSSASCVQSISVVDTTAPVLSGVPGDAAVQCDALPPTPTVTATDACEGSVAVSISESQVAGSCPGTYVLTRTWTAGDGCGNSVSASQDVAVMDTVDPVLLGVPGDVSVECDAVPPPATVTASDTCDTNIPVTFIESQSNGSCPDEYVLTRSWSATDDCGNDVTGQQFVTVDDTTPPSISCPANAVLECPANTGAAANGSAAGTDNCGIVTIGSSDSLVAGCGTTQTITRTWTVGDECGNASTCDQLIAVVDTAAPVITVNTSPITVTDTDCTGSETVALPAATAIDACDGARPVTNNAPPSFPTGSTTVTYTASDACGNTANASLQVNVLFGATIDVQADRHTVGPGSHPTDTKSPLAGILVCAYDKTVHSCANTLCSGISHQEYQCILDTCTPAGCGVTDSTGEALIHVPPGNYIVASGDATKTTLPDPLGVSVGDVQCGEVKQKYLQQIVQADGSKKPAKYTVLTGSMLLIIEPEYIIWDNTQQLYPFVFETIGDWSVTASVTPPEGFVADYDQLSAHVDNELESVQFTITEVGSDLVPTQTQFDIVHKGKRQTVRSNIGILLTPEYAKSRGFDVAKLKGKGLIVEPQRRDDPKLEGIRAGSR